jgi:hypothetical protein
MCLLFSVLQCSEEPELGQREVKAVSLVFTSDGISKTVDAKFIYNAGLNRYQLLSEVLVEIEAIHESTREVIYVYALKSELEASVPHGKSEIMTGYYGYAGGCFYFGTLYVGENGESIFVPASGINSIANPQICPGGEWT